MKTLLLLLLPLAATAGDKSPLVPPSEKVAGSTQVEWSSYWWQWAASFSDQQSPVADKTGARCHLRQGKGVWFLAGTYGTQRTIRTCTVPADTYLFIPLINYVIFQQPGPDFSCEYATARAASITEGVSSLVLEVDGKIYRDLESHRMATTKCFDLNQGTGGPTVPAASNGYYVMLRPLGRGTHTINFGGILPNMMQAVTYTLHVK